MKKQKMLKLIASISEPSLESSFSAPLTHSGEISVVSKGKSISIHGWDGNAWSTIHVADGSNPQFKFENNYQNYFLKSLTGQEEEIYVSFFSVASIQNSKPLLAGVQRTTKLYDIDEVPIYNADDANKLLTVMSDGSLRWLLLNETFNVDGSPVIVTGPSGNGTFVEESGLMTITNGSLVDGVLSTNNSKIRKSDMLSLTSAVGPTNKAVFSAWFKVNSFNNPYWIGLFGNSNSQMGFTARIRRSDGQVQMGTSVGGVTFTGAIPVIGEWNHFVMVYEDLNGNAVSLTDAAFQKSHSLKVYFNGSLVDTKTATNGYSLFGSTDFFPFGQWYYNGQSYDANNNSYDFVELVTGAGLTDAQVLAMYNNGERGWSVEDGMNYSS